MVKRSGVGGIMCGNGFVFVGKGKLVRVHRTTDAIKCRTIKEETMLEIVL